MLSFAVGHAIWELQPWISSDLRMRKVKASRQTLLVAVAVAVVISETRYWSIEK